MKISRITRCLRLSRNDLGRDFVVGDLHGHRAWLELALDEVGFDAARDRLLSVGDLVNRGPDSLGTLALIEQPWFRAVLGNHELMLLNHLGYYGSRIHSRRSVPRGGDWIVDAALRQPKLLGRLADRVATLPLAIHVDGDMAFNVMHGDLHPVGSQQTHLFSADSICVHKADVLTTSRGNIGGLLRDELELLEFAGHEVRVSSSPLGCMPITYVGHSPMSQITVHNSYVYIDQGVSLRSAKRSVGAATTVLNHHRFAYWLGGVASARARDRGMMAPVFRPAMA